MTETEAMSVNERRKYLHKMRLRYWQAESKSAKSALLDEMELVTHLHRKSVIRLLTGELARMPRRTQRGKTYGAEVKAVVEKVAYSLDYLCRTLASELGVDGRASGKAWRDRSFGGG